MYWCYASSHLSSYSPVFIIPCLQTSAACPSVPHLCSGMHLLFILWDLRMLFFSFLCFFLILWIVPFVLFACFMSLSCVTSFSHQDSDLVYCRRFFQIQCSWSKMANVVNLFNTVTEAIGVIIESSKSQVCCSVSVIPPLMISNLLVNPNLCLPMFRTPVLHQWSHTLTHSRLTWLSQTSVMTNSHYLFYLWSPYWGIWGRRAAAH